jgi:glutamine synthetase
MAGIEDAPALPEPIGEDPGGWPDEDREARGGAPAAGTSAEQDAALVASPWIAGVLGDELLGAFRAVRASDAAWAADRTADEIVAAHLWRY